MNPNCLFSTIDYCTSGVIDTICQDTGVIPLATTGYPLSNLLVEDLFSAAQFATNDITNTQFVIDLGRVQPVSIVALLKHNVNAGAHWNVSLYDTLANYQGTAPIYDSGVVPMIPDSSEFGDLAWGAFLWGETTSEIDLVGYNRHSYMPLGAIFNARYISVSIVADTNDELITAYRFWAGLAYQPTYNADYGSELEPVDETPIKKGYTGGRTYGETVKRRQIKVNFSTLPQAEFLSKIYGALYLRNGAKKPFIFMLFPNDSELWLTTSIFGNIQPQNPNALSFVSWEHMGVQSLTIEELV
jgi:hypothetical protein